MVKYSADFINLSILILHGIMIHQREESLYD